MKKLINVRGACGSGKTTMVREFCNRKGFTVEKATFNDGNTSDFSVMDGGKIVALGDYTLSGCTGCDRFKGGSKQIKATVKEAIRRYNPDILIYEHMLSSTCSKGTKETAEIGKTFGYEYKGVQLMCDDASRFERIEKRSGKKARTKNFVSNGNAVVSATRHLNEAGYRVKTVDVSNIPKADMWKILDEVVNE